MMLLKYLAARQLLPKETLQTSPSKATTRMQGNRQGLSKEAPDYNTG